MTSKNKQTKRQFLSSLKKVIFSIATIHYGTFKNIVYASNKQTIIRPPGAIAEDHFIQRCIRCGNCLKICPTNVLQPLSLERNITSMWTPYLNYKIGYCEYHCNLCGKVCPTGAIQKLTKKNKNQLKIGLAEINQETCIPWKKKANCIVCEEHCPIDTKAIKIKEEKLKDGTILMLPVVDPCLCIGCGICEHKCPTRPNRSIKVKNS